MKNSAMPTVANQRAICLNQSEYDCYRSGAFDWLAHHAGDEGRAAAKEVGRFLLDEAGYSILNKLCIAAEMVAWGQRDEAMVVARKYALSAGVSQEDRVYAITGLSDFGGHDEAVVQMGKLLPGFIEGVAALESAVNWIDEHDLSEGFAHHLACIAENPRANGESRSVAVNTLRKWGRTDFAEIAEKTFGKVPGQHKIHQRMSDPEARSNDLVDRLVRNIERQKEENP